MKPLTVLYVTLYFSQSCEGTYGRFHDIIHTLQRMEAPPILHRVVPIVRYKGAPAPDVLFRPGSRTQRFSHYLQVVRRISQDVDLVHVIQADLIASFFSSLLVPRDKPVVLGPNISLGKGRVGKAIPPWTTLKGFLFRARLSRQFRARLVIHRLSPLSSHFSRFFCFSPIHQDLCVAGGLAPSRIEVVPTGVRTDVFNPDGERIPRSSGFTILYVGRADKYVKGFDVLVEALGLLKQTGLRFHCLAVGSRNPNPSLTHQHRVTDYIEFVDFVPRSELPKYYRSADVFVSPSRIEMDGNTAVEALACGTPVIGSDIPAFQDKTTLTFKCGDSADLAAKLQEYYDQREMLRARVRAEAGNWSIQPAIEKFVSVYQRVLVEDSAKR